MVFSSIPVYLDSANWQQQQNHHQSGSSGGTDGVNPQFLPPPPPLPPQHPHVGGHSGSIRPGSMADRARMANISLPETALKCPRCESTNTKFCYFNNYSLTQPRHFCKTCRRYWTRGGALRNVPVGGGCRRNKRSKGSSASGSKSPVSGDRQAAAAASSASTTSSILGLSSQIPPLQFMSPLHQLTDYGEAGLNYGGISAPVGAAGDMSFQIGGGGGYLSGGGMEQWRLQQTQILLGGLEGQSGLYPFQGGAETSGYAGEASQQVRPGTSASGIIQMAPVKMEENQELSLSRQFMGIQGNDQYWSSTATAAWTDLSGFSSSSTSNPL